MKNISRRQFLANSTGALAILQVWAHCYPDAEKARISNRGVRLDAWLRWVG